MILRFFSRHAQSFLFALRTILSHKARTFLALLGVVIGVLSIIVITSFGDGVKGFILGQVASFGSDFVQVETQVPGAGDSPSGQAMGKLTITTLKIDDAEAVRRLPNVAEVYAGSIGQERASYRGVHKRILLFGASATAPIVDPNLKLESGRFYSTDDGLAQVVVLGADIKDALFGRESEAVGETIRIKGQGYKVVGVLARRGSVAFLNFDEMTYVPVRTLQKKILGVNHIAFFTSKMNDISREDETVALIRETLRRRHDITDPDRDDFIVTSAREAQETVSSILGAMSLLLMFLTSISLVVGGVGIMNVMYVSVAERTSEIGLRKAVGASSKSVLWQFLFEALIITVLGGLIGVLLGVIVTWGLTFLSGQLGYGLELAFTLRSFLLGVGFAGLVGIVFGLAPAYRASRLSPMEALRRE
jgi:putative ABC transport system permease protein